MGCYDTVEVPCPECGKVEYFQSKGGDCRMANYTLDYAPNDVLDDINRHSPYTCRECDTTFCVMVKKMAIPVKWRSTYNPHNLYGEENE